MENENLKDNEQNNTNIEKNSSENNSGNIEKEENIINNNNQTKNDIPTTFQENNIIIEKDNEEEKENSNQIISQKDEEPKNIDDNKKEKEEKEEVEKKENEEKKEEKKENEEKKEEKEKKNKYILEIQKILNFENQNKEYIKKINNNPEELFEILNDRTLIFWQSVVYNFEATIIDSDGDILTVVPDRKDQNVIINDCNRTRFRECSLVPGFKKILEEVLTFYCNVKGINYKQGLNEIFGPLILMKYKIKYLKLLNIFNLGEAFIDRFLPNYYYEKDLYSLKSSISLFVLLFKYHEPNIFNYLDSFEIPHELYAANWLVTLRAQKLNLDILYNLWDTLMKVNDPLFIHFILVALIKYKRELLINCDSNLLLKLMVGLTITSKDELNDIIKIALELRKNTPYSFRLLSNEIGFLKINNKNIKENFDKYKPESIPTMPIFPIEILYQNYSNNIICPDPKCVNNKKYKIENENETEVLNNEIINNNYSCEKCKMKIEKNINYIILDLRLFTPSYFNDSDDYFKMGFVSGMMAIDKEELKLDNVDTLLSSRLFSIRGKNHIILMTSKTDYFSDFEQKYYSDSRSELMKKKILFGVVEAQKEEKILNLEDAQKNLDLKELYKLKEYDNLKKIIIKMKNNNFPYVSYLEGGFEALHQESLNYNIELVDHNSKKCRLCKKIKKESKEEKIYKKLNTEEKIINISNTLWKNEKTITAQELNSFFSNDNNIVLVCGLTKYKTKYFHKNEVEVFVAILFDKNIIEIYKNDFKKEKTTNKGELYNSDNINYYNLGIKEDKNAFLLRLFDDVKFEDIEKCSFNKNISSLQVANKDSDKKKMKIDNSYEIQFQFYSIQDSKTFKNSIQKIKNRNF